MFSTLKNLLPQSVKNAGAVRQVRAALVIAAASSALAEIFGPEISQRMQPKSFRLGTLKIVCDRSVYAQELKLKEEEVAASLNKKLGSNVVVKIFATGNR